MDRVYNSIEGTGYSSNTYGPTKQHMKSLDIAKEMYQRLSQESISLTVMLKN